MRLNIWLLIDEIDLDMSDYYVNKLHITLKNQSLIVEAIVRIVIYYEFDTFEYEIFNDAEFLIFGVRDRTEIFRKSLENDVMMSFNYY